MAHWLLIGYYRHLVGDVNEVPKHLFVYHDCMDPNVIDIIMI